MPFFSGFIPSEDRSSSVSWPYLASLGMPLDQTDPPDFCDICIHPVARATC
jgi:hypothetical protein